MRSNKVAPQHSYDRVAMPHSGRRSRPEPQFVDPDQEDIDQAEDAAFERSFRGSDSSGSRHGRSCFALLCCLTLLAAAACILVIATRPYSSTSDSNSNELSAQRQIEAALNALARANRTSSSSSSSTGSFQPNDLGTTGAGGAGTSVGTASDAPNSTASSSSTSTGEPQVAAVPDPSCLVTNVEIGFAQCSNRLNGSFSTDSLFVAEPDRRRDLGLCVVPYDHTLLRQFVAVRTPSLPAGQFFRVYEQPDTFTPVAQYTAESQDMQFLQLNASTPRLRYELQSSFADPNPAYYYRGEGRLCAGVFEFELALEQCACEQAVNSTGTTTLLQSPCDCSNFSLPSSSTGVAFANQTFDNSSSTGEAGAAASFAQQQCAPYAPDQCNAYNISDSYPALAEGAALASPLHVHINHNADNYLVDLTTDNIASAEYFCENCPGFVQTGDAQFLVPELSPEILLSTQPQLLTDSGTDILEFHYVNASVPVDQYLRLTITQGLRPEAIVVSLTDNR